MRKDHILALTLLALLAAAVYVPLSIPASPTPQLLSPIIAGGGQDRSLIMWLPLQEGGGNAAYDYSYNGLNGLWSGTAAGTSGYYSAGHNQNSAGTFNGSDDVVTIEGPYANFTFTNIATLFGTMTQLDYFQRADGPLDGHWGTVVSENIGSQPATYGGGIQILNDAYGPINSNGGDGVSIFPGNYPNDQWVQGTVSTIAPPTSVVAITAASFSTPNTTYTYTLTSGNTLIVPQEIIITGMADAGNNSGGSNPGGFLTTALGSGTFTVANANGVTRSGQSGVGSSPSDSGVGLCVRCTPDGQNGYLFSAGSNSYSGSPAGGRTYYRELWQIVSGTPTILSQSTLVTTPDVPGDVYTLIAADARVMVLKNGLLLSMTSNPYYSTSLASGSPGIWTWSLSGANEYNWANWNNQTVMDTPPGNNGTTWTNWKTGYVIATPPALPTSAITVSARIYPTTLNGENAVVSKYPGSWLLQPQSHTPFWYVITTNGSQHISGGTVNVNNSYLLTGTYDGAHIALYLNGSSVATPVAQTGAITANASYNLLVGKYGSGQWFTGLIQDVRIYNRALSSAEVSDLYQGGNP